MCAKGLRRTSDKGLLRKSKFLGSKFNIPFMQCAVFEPVSRKKRRGRDLFAKVAFLGVYVCGGVRDSRCLCYLYLKANEKSDTKRNWSMCNKGGKEKGREKT